MARVSRAALAVTLIAGLVAGCGGASKTSSSTVSATAYVTALCQAVAPFERDVASRSSDLSNRASLTATAGKHELVSYLGALSDDSSHAAAKLKAAGAPQVTGGASFARRLLATFTRLGTALARSKQLASQLSTSDAASFQVAATRLTRAVEASVGTLGTGLSTTSNQALDRAAAKVSACHTL